MKLNYLKRELNFSTGTYARVGIWEFEICKKICQDEINRPYVERLCLMAPLVAFVKIDFWGEDQVLFYWSFIYWSHYVIVGPYYLSGPYIFQPFL